jgi:hypothetical protein
VNAPHVISEHLNEIRSWPTLRGLDFGADIHQRDSGHKALLALRNSSGLTMAHVLTVAL